MRHRSFLQHPNLDPSYHIDNTASTSLSLGHILQPQPMRPIPRSLARKADWRVAPQDDDRTYLDEDSFAATCFPAPENTLGLFSTDPKYSAVAGSSGYHPRHMPTPPTRRKIEDYEREGGWSFDAIGQTHYVPHAGIMVVDEDDKNLAIPDSFLEQELPPDTTPPPRPKQRPIELIPLPVLDRLPLGPLGDKSKTRIGPPPRDFLGFYLSNDMVAEDSPTFIDEWLPTDRTPPRCKKRPVGSLSPVDRPPLDDETNTHIGPPTPRSHNLPASFRGNDNRRTTPLTGLSPRIRTQSQERDVVEKALESIMTASLEIVSLHARFGALPKPTASDRALCDKVGKTLHAVQESLRRHRVVPAEQWSLRSVSCRRKYDYRITSLQRTLSRLHNLSTVSPRVNQVHRARKLLEQHDAKLSDLATKFNGMFDRLDARHFHSFLAGVRADYQRVVTARKEERRTARAARSGLYEYALHRQGRRPLIVTAS